MATMKPMKPASPLWMGLPPHVSERDLWTTRDILLYVLFYRAWLVRIYNPVEEALFLRDMKSVLPQRYVATRDGTFGMQVRFAQCYRNKVFVLYSYRGSASGKRDDLEFWAKLYSEVFPK